MDPGFLTGGRRREQEGATVFVRFTEWAVIPFQSPAAPRNTAV